MVQKPGEEPGTRRDSWGLIYHLFLSAYGWTIQQVDDLTVPQFQALLLEMKENPPVNFLLSAGLKRRGGPVAGPTQSPAATDNGVESQLRRFGNHVVNGGVPKGRIVIGKTGRRLVITEKRTGKRVG